VQASLNNLTILVTRPDAQQHALLEAIAGAGGQSVSFPLLSIEGIEEKKAISSLRRQVENLDRFNLLIFISTNAAQFGCDLIDSYWPQFPVGIEVLAVGPSTAEAVKERLACSVISSQTGMASEDLLELPELKAVAGKRIALFRGVGGRELLAATLRERGAEVEYFEVYKRTTVAYADDALVNKIEATGVNVITAFSGESLNRLLQLATTDEQRKRLLAIPVLVPSERVADLAAAEGFSSVYNANGANVAATLSTLQKIAAEADKAL
jgi:uroporphyrinogen-III synthase